MSVNANYGGNIAKPVHLVLAGSTTALVGSAMTDNSMTLSSWAFCNPTGGAVTCSLYWYDASASTERLIWQKSVATIDTVVESNLPLRLWTGDEIRAKGANTVTVTLTMTMNLVNSQ
ncbi:hypothetical protein [Rhizobium hidalgonense]|uniref:hypothetical protein n=1 Tax=Rhizobium hidalgonense TaxID=1538159 RepID=UPI002870D957|nr:hypothetical protein [Rhizobium hidalgonense]MDR9813111.1 hypothetical protein [Rhizobium hidalgonense]